ncbi:hypothetical protein ACIRYZ_44880 [Kitasatospora sp. NPDC101155]|uniref:hypothetical protein n=1 Tax=Kitasatospora sp. NPDC101155 TaxID=3364097 RepID=UPI003816D421
MHAQDATDRVTLVLKRRDAAGPEVGGEDGGVARIGTVPHHPLGTRALVDAVTGEPVPHTDAHTQPRAD